METSPYNTDLDAMLTDPHVGLMSSVDNMDFWDPFMLNSDLGFGESTNAEQNDICTDAVPNFNNSDCLLGDLCSHLDLQVGGEHSYASAPIESSTSSIYGPTASFSETPSEETDVLQAASFEIFGNGNHEQKFSPILKNDIKSELIATAVSPTPSVILPYEANQFGVIGVDKRMNLSMTRNGGRDMLKEKRKYPPLLLTDEEKKLCKKEGVRLPEFYPLTKYEERELKRIRRKIRNKHSAQTSRKKKQDYIEALEDRVVNCTQENEELKKQVEQLKKLNSTYLSQLRKLRSMVVNGSKRKVHAGTCLAVLMLSVCLLIAPNVSPLSEERSNEEEVEKIKSAQVQEEEMKRIPPLAGRSRSLLQFVNSVTNKFDVDFCDEVDEYDSISTLKSQYRKVSRNNPQMNRRDGVVCWNKGVTTLKMRIPNSTELRGKTLPKYGCTTVGNYTLKRKTFLEGNSKVSSPDYNKKSWMGTLNSAEYKEAKMSNGSTFRVFKDPGSYISINS